MKRQLFKVKPWAYGMAIGGYGVQFGTPPKSLNSEKAIKKHYNDGDDFVIISRGREYGRLINKRDIENAFASGYSEIFLRCYSNTTQVTLPYSKRRPYVRKKM